MRRVLTLVVVGTLELYRLGVAKPLFLSFRSLSDFCGVSHMYGEYEMLSFLKLAKPSLPLSIVIVVKPNN